MAMYLSSQLLHRNGGIAIVGETNYIAASLTLEHAGAKVMTVPVDEKGLVTEEIERICNNTMELREQYNWVEVVERYVDKDNNLLFSFNTKESCKSVNYNQSSKKTIQDVVRRLR